MKNDDPVYTFDVSNVDYIEMRWHTPYRLYWWKTQGIFSLVEAAKNNIQVELPEPPNKWPPISMRN